MNKKTTPRQEKSEKALTPGGLRPKDQVHLVAAGQKLRMSKEGARVEAQRGLRPAMRASEATTLVLTPGGYRHPALVHRLEPQHVLQLTKDRPRIRDSQTKKAMDIAKVSIAPEGIPALGSGWIAYAHWTNTTGNPITSFRTTWQVPPAPATQGSQTIFLFNGINPSDPSDGILQPVLQWGPSAAGGGSYWSVASWYVGGDGHAFHTALAPVNFGDTLVGVMTLTDNANGLFNYVCEFEGLAGTRLPVENLPELVWCNETLEAYSVSQGSDYPDTDATRFGGIALQTGQIAPSVVWTPETNVTDCGQHVEVVSNSATDGVVDIYYRTPKVAQIPLEALAQQVKILFGVANDGGGFVILPNGHIVRIPPRHPEDPVFQQVTSAITELARSLALRGISKGGVDSAAAKILQKHVMESTADNLEVILESIKKAITE